MQSGRHDRRRRRERITSQPRRQAQARGGGRDQRYRSSRNYRTIRGTDTGYNLQKRTINFAGARGGARGRIASVNPRPAILIVATVAIAALVIFGISRCVASCSANNAREEANEQDGRVAAGVSSELTTRLGRALDQGEQMADIATRANALDTRLVELALSEPAAIGFVASYDPDGTHDASAYDAQVTKGSYTTVFCWDRRWGAVDFAGGPMAVTGSGPVALFIARAGLVGNAEASPADIAAMAESAQATDATLGLAPTFLAEGTTGLDLAVTQHDVTADRIAEVLDAGTVILLQTKEDGLLGDAAHWVLAATENADGTVNVCDPTSPDVSAYPWATSTLAGAADAMYAITAAQVTGQDAG